MRLIFKTTSYGILHILVATTVAYIITGSFMMALGIGLIEPIVQTCVFAVHEYFWERDNPKGNKRFFIGCHGFDMKNR